MKITLDHTALQCLFPEGSQARLELSQAVINNFVNKAYNKKMNDIAIEEVNKIVRTINSEVKAAGFDDATIKDIIRRELSKLAVSQYFDKKITKNGTDIIKNDVKQLLTDEIKIQIKNELSEIINEVFSQYKKDINTEAKRRATYLVDQIPSAVQSLAKKIIEEKFNKQQIVL